MPRVAAVHWDRAKGAWRTDTGGKTTYFRGIAKSDKAGAREALDRLVRERQSASYNPTDPTVEELAELYLKHTRRTARPRTFRGQKEMLLCWVDFPKKEHPSRMGLRRAKSIRASDLAAMERAWANAEKSPHYRARLIRTVKACWAWAAKGDAPLVPVNALKDVPSVPVPHSRKRRVPKSEFGPFARWCWRRARANPTIVGRFDKLTCLLIRFIRITGCRPGEACDLRWGDIDRESGIASIPPERHKTGGKTGRPRIIVLTPALMRMLGAIERLPGRHGSHVFTHKRGKHSAAKGATREAGEPWDSRVLAQKVRKLRNAAIDAGIPVRADFRLYDLRHEVASAGRARGVGDDAIGVVLGTSGKMIQTTYGHLTPDDLRAVADRMRGKD